MHCCCGVLVTVGCVASSCVGCCVLLRVAMCCSLFAVGYRCMLGVVCVVNVVFCLLGLVAFVCCCCGWMIYCLLCDVWCFVVLCV